jgi:hypothetical protein
MSEKQVQKAFHPIQKKTWNAPYFYFPWKNMNPFFEFRHSIISISQFDGKTRIEARENRFVDGKLESERFEAEAEPEFFKNAVGQICGAYLDFISQLMAPFTRLNPFLPFPGRDSLKKE